MRTIVAIGACIVAASASAQQFTMKLSSPTINDVTQEWMKAFKTGVETRSGGKLKIESEADVYKALGMNGDHYHVFEDMFAEEIFTKDASPGS